MKNETVLTSMIPIMLVLSAPVFATGQNQHQQTLSLSSSTFSRMDLSKKPEFNSELISTDQTKPTKNEVSIIAISGGVNIPLYQLKATRISSTEIRLEPDGTGNWMYNPDGMYSGM